MGILFCMRIALCFLSIFLAPALYAQNDNQINNLSELFRLAEMNSPAISSAKVGLQATSEKVHQAFAAFMPSVSYSGSKTQQATRTVTNNILMPDSDTTIYKQEITLTQPLYNRASSIQYRIAKLQIEKQEYELRQQILDLKNKVAQAYFLILTYEDTLSLIDAQKIHSNNSYYKQSVVMN